MEQGQKLSLKIILPHCDWNGEWNVNKLVFEILIFLAGGPPEPKIKFKRTMPANDWVCTKYFDIRT